MPLLGLSNELLISTASYVWKDEQWGLDYLNTLILANRHLHALLTPSLYSAVDAMYLLVWAINNDRPSTITSALSHGANPNEPYLPDGDYDPIDIYQHFRPATEIAIHRCCNHPHDPAAYDTLSFLLASGGRPTRSMVYSAVVADDLGLIRLLAAHGANLNVRDHAGRYPLSDAATLCRTSVMRLLLELGANANSGSDGKPPLWEVELVLGGSLEAVRILLEAGADATVEFDGASLVEVLWERLGVSCRDQRLVEIIELLGEYGARMPENVAAEVD